MRTIHTLLMAMATVSATAATQSVTVSDVNVERSASSLVVTMNLDATAMKLKSDREIKYIPVITNGTERRELPEVIIAGRNRYIQNQRHDTPEAPAILRVPDTPSAIQPSSPTSSGWKNRALCS